MYEPHLFGLGGTGQIGDVEKDRFLVEVANGGVAEEHKMDICCQVDG